MVEPRPPVPTVKFVDEYCQLYQNLFPEVRSFEAFKYLHMGCVSDIKRKTLPEIGRIVGLDNHQPLHHSLTESPWDVKELRKQRLELILYILQGRPIILIIDETGDKKKGNTTDYVKRQYIGNLGKTDSLYGESGKNFLSVLNEFNLNFIVAIRSNHRAWGITDSKVKYSDWQRFKRVFSDLSSENRYIREIICGEKSKIRYWQITTDKEELPKNTTWYVMSKYPEITPREVGNFYGLRTWVEYGLKQSKNELGWADFRLTHYSQIEKWWEIVFSAYLLVSLHSE